MCRDATVSNFIVTMKMFFNTSLLNTELFNIQQPGSGE